MIRLDESISNLIGPLIGGDHVSLSPQDQYDLAIWVTKICFVFESLSGRDKVIPNTEYHAFYKNRQANPREPIHLARYVGTDPHIYARRVLKIVNLPSFEVASVEGVLMTIIVGELIMQTTLRTPTSKLMTFEVPGDDRIGIWPFRIEPVAWPPVKSTAYADLPAFTGPADG